MILSTTAIAPAQGGLFTISGRQWLILLMVQLANMLFGMTITLANLVLPQMRGNLSATPEEISWVITLNLVATAVATPMTGWLSSRLGWRNLMFFTVLGFTVTSLLCGFAGSLETLIFVGVLALWVFVVHGLTVREPFLNPRLLLDRNFSSGVLLAFVMGMLNVASIVLYPTLLHDLRGYPDNAIAGLIAARGLGNWAAFLFIAQFTRIAPRFAIVCGMTIQAAAGFWMAQFDINLTDSNVFWSNLLLGFGQSIAFTPMTVMAFSTLAPRLVTERSSVFTLMRNFGSSLFISISVLVVSRSTASNYSRLTEIFTPYNKTLTMH